MRTDSELIVLPYDADDGNRLLDRLICELRADEWTEFWAAVAFASARANIPDFVDALEDFVTEGHPVTVTFCARRFLGGGYATDYEVVECLAELFDGHPNARLHLYGQGGITFHPKLYLFASDHRARLIVGSSNWGEYGWVRNVEANVVLTLDLDDPECRTVYDRIISYFDQYWTAVTTTDEGQGYAEEVTLDNLEMFTSVLRMPDERRTTRPELTDDEGDGDEQDGETQGGLPEGLFDGEPFRVSLGRTGAPTTGTGGEDEPGEPAEVTEADGRGPILWRKPELSATDAQRQTGHPTGSMRLTQAEWTVGGNVIDQTSYFRNNVFGGLDWEVGRRDPYREDASALFEITVRGEDLGQHELRITHKPTGEAGQGNYTTSLHWDELTQTIQELDVEDETFELFGPPPGRNEPYFVVIG